MLKEPMFQPIQRTHENFCKVLSNAVEESKLNANDLGDWTAQAIDEGHKSDH